MQLVLLMYSRRPWKSTPFVNSAQVDSYNGTLEVAVVIVVLRQSLNVFWRDNSLGDRALTSFIHQDWIYFSGFAEKVDSCDKQVCEFIRNIWFKNCLFVCLFGGTSLP